MSKISTANLKKTLHYLKRNGIRNTCYAIAERWEEQAFPQYAFVPAAASKLERQRSTAGQFSQTFSIVVPTYRTKERYLRELIACIQNQTYGRWELLLADATEDDSVEKLVRAIVGKELQIAEKESCTSEGLNKAEKESCTSEGLDKAGKDRQAAGENTGSHWQDSCVRYIRLPGNAGIAENTNRALAYAQGAYIGLLDHDDVLTSDALYEMASAITRGNKAGVEVQMLYSDEDKCDGEGKNFFEPNFKVPFNLDLLLSNNYICHFLVMKSSLIKKLGFRTEYEGAQDYDLVLRAAAALMNQEEKIVHVPKVLYHWRCHTASTAENPQSKMYAYEAGSRALLDFARTQNWKVTVQPLKHLGFYQMDYQGGALKVREDLGAVGGRLFVKNRTAGGGMTAEGEVLYRGLRRGYSGYLHRASLGQDVEALDIRCIQVKKELWPLFEAVTGAAYREIQETGWFDISLLPENTDYIQLSLRLSQAIRQKGYRLLYIPV